jgi:hypothetical protein
MTITVTAKTKIYVGTTAAAANLTQFEADTWTEIKQVEDLGEFGDAAEEITFTTLEDARVRKLKGARDAGVIELVVARDAADAGQGKLRDAVNDDHAVNVKVVMNDAPVDGTPTEFFFRGLVMGMRTNFGSAKDVVKTSFNISIVSEILEVPAAA